MKKVSNKNKITYQQVAVPRTNGNATKLFNSHKKEIFRVDPFAVPEGATVLDGVRKTVFVDRYSWKDEDGSPIEEVPEQMWARVAKTMAQVEKKPLLRKKWEEKFYNCLSGFKFLPAGRILSAAGTGYEVTYYNCFVIPSPEDSRGGILDNLKIMIEMMARAGGVGINLSSLRPRGARVQKVNGTSSGPMNWATLYSVSTRDIVQQGGSRRGALMLMLHDWHPDIEEFITVKQDPTKILGANLSVCVSDAFMEAVDKDEDWNLRFPDTKDPHYDLEWDGDLLGWEAKGYPVKIYKTVKAKEIWDLICQAAWASAEPGLHFLDRSNKWSNTWYFEKLICTNPCGEQPLGAWSVCNLGAMNLSAFVEDGVMNFEKLAENVKVATRFLDNAIDANYYFYPENKEQQVNIRRTGLGTMGLGDALIKMKIRYGSDESLLVIEKIYETIRDAAYEASSDISLEKGSFAMFDREKYAKGHFIKDLPETLQKKIYKQGIRNAVILTQAPTGTTSLLAGVSSGIEPVYDFAMVRRDRTGEHIIYHPLFKEWKDANPGVETVPSYFVSSNDLTPEDHVRVQAMVQKYTDSSISKTVNAPNSFTVEEVQRLYMQAYKLGCKGVTFYRDGSREAVLTRLEDEKKPRVEPPSEGKAAASRPMILRGRTYKMNTPVGKAYVSINRNEKDQPFEVFVTIGKAGMHTFADAEAMGRLASLALRISSPDSKEVAREIVEQLRGIGGSSQVGFGKDRVMSLADAIAKALAEDLALNEGSEVLKSAEPIPLNLTIDNGTGQSNRQTNGENLNDPTPELTSEANFPRLSSYIDLCPECGDASFVFEEGCKKCHSCGYSMC